MHYAWNNSVLRLKMYFILYHYVNFDIISITCNYEGTLQVAMAHIIKG